MNGNAALSISSSSFASCYSSGGVSAWLGVMVHGTLRLGADACMYIHVVVLAVFAQPTLRGDRSPLACPVALHCIDLRGAPLRTHLTVHMLHLLSPVW